MRCSHGFEMCFHTASTRSRRDLVRLGNGSYGERCCRFITISAQIGLERVKWAGYVAGRLQYMRIDHCGLQAAMPQQQLDGPNVGAGCQQMGGEGVAQAMCTGVLVNLS